MALSIEASIDALLASIWENILVKESTSRSMDMWRALGIMSLHSNSVSDIS